MKLLAVVLGIFLAVASAMDSPGQIDLSAECDNSQGTCIVTGGSYKCSGGELFTGDYTGSVKIVGAIIDLSDCSDYLDTATLTKNYWKQGVTDLTSACAIRTALDDDAPVFKPYCKDAQCTHYGNDDCKLSVVDGDAVLPGRLDFLSERDETVKNIAMSFSTTEGLEIDLTVLDTDLPYNTPAMQIFRISGDSGTSICSKGAQFTSFQTELGEGSSTALGNFLASDNTGTNTYNSCFMRSHSTIASALAREAASVEATSITEINWRRGDASDPSVGSGEVNIHFGATAVALRKCTNGDDPKVSNGFRTQSIYVDVINVHPVLDNGGLESNSGAYATCETRKIVLKQDTTYNVIVVAEELAAMDADMLINTFDYTNAVDDKSTFTLRGQFLLGDADSHKDFTVTELAFQSTDTATCGNATVTVGVQHGFQEPESINKSHHSTPFTITITNVEFPEGTSYREMSAVLTNAGCTGLDLLAKKITYKSGDETLTLSSGAANENVEIGFGLNLNALHIGPPNRAARTLVDEKTNDSIHHSVTLTCYVQDSTGKDYGDNLCDPSSETTPETLNFALEVGEQIKVNWAASGSQYSKFSTTGVQVLGESSMIEHESGFTSSLGTSEAFTGREKYNGNGVTINSACTGTPTQDSEGGTESSLYQRSGSFKFAVTERGNFTIDFAWTFDWCAIGSGNTHRRRLLAASPGNSVASSAVSITLAACDSGAAGCVTSSHAVNAQLQRNIRAQFGALALNAGVVTFDTTVADVVGMGLRPTEAQRLVFEFGRKSGADRAKLTCSSEHITSSNAEIYDETDANTVAAGSRSGACQLGKDGDHTSLSALYGTSNSAAETNWKQTATVFSSSGVEMLGPNGAVTGAPTLKYVADDNEAAVVSFSGDLTDLKACGVVCSKSDMLNKTTVCTMDMVVRSFNPDAFPLANFPTMYESCDSVTYTISRDDALSGSVAFQAESGEASGIADKKWVSNGASWDLQVTYVYEHKTEQRSAFQHRRLADVSSATTIPDSSDATASVKSFHARAGNNLPLIMSIATAPSPITARKDTHQRSTVVLTYATDFSPSDSNSSAGNCPASDWQGDYDASNMFSLEISPDKCKTTSANECEFARYADGNLAERAYRSVSLDLSGFSSCPVMNEGAATVHQGQDVTTVDMEAHYRGTESATEYRTSQFLRAAGSSIFIRMETDDVANGLELDRQQIRYKTITATSPTQSKTLMLNGAAVAQNGTETSTAQDGTSATTPYSVSVSDCGLSSGGQSNYCASTCDRLTGTEGITFVNYVSKNILEIPTLSLGPGTWTIDIDFEILSCGESGTRRRLLSALDDSASTGKISPSQSQQIKIQIVDTTSEQIGVTYDYQFKWDGDGDFSRNGVAIGMELTNYNLQSKTDKSYRHGITFFSMEEGLTCEGSLIAGTAQSSWTGTDKFADHTAASPKCMMMVGRGSGNSQITSETAWDVSMHNPSLSVPETTTTDGSTTALGDRLPLAVTRDGDTLDFTGAYENWDKLIQSNCASCTANGTTGRKCTTELQAQTVFPVGSYDSGYDYGFSLCSTLSLSHEASWEADRSMSQTTAQSYSQGRQVDVSFHGTPYWAKGTSADETCSAGDSCYVEFDVDVRIEDDSLSLTASATLGHLSSRRLLHKLKTLGADTSAAIGKNHIAKYELITASDSAYKSGFATYRVTLRSKEKTLTSESDCKIDSDEFHFSFEPRSCVNDLSDAIVCLDYSSFGYTGTTYPINPDGEMEGNPSTVSVDLDFQYNVCPISMLHVAETEHKAANTETPQPKMRVFNSRAAMVYKPSSLSDTAHTSSKEGKFFHVGDTITVDFRTESNNTAAWRPGLEIIHAELCSFPAEATVGADCTSSVNKFTLVQKSTGGIEQSTLQYKSQLNTTTCWLDADAQSGPKRIGNGNEITTAACSQRCNALEDKGQLAALDHSAADGIAFDVLSFHADAAISELADGANWLIYAEAHQFDCDYDTIAVPPSRRRLLALPAPSLRGPKTVTFRKLLQIAPTGSAATVASSASFQILPAVAANAAATTAAATTPIPAPAAKDSGLSDAAIAGIVLGGVALLVLYCGLVRPSKPTMTRSLPRRSNRLQRSKHTYTPVKSYN